MFRVTNLVLRGGLDDLTRPQQCRACNERAETLSGNNIVIGLSKQGNVQGRSRRVYEPLNSRRHPKDGLRRPPSTAVSGRHANPLADVASDDAAPWRIVSLACSQSFRGPSKRTNGHY